MDTEGILRPETAEQARERHAALAPVAKTVVTEAAKAMAFDDEEFDERLTGEVVATAHDALFASLLVVTVGTRAEFEDWRADYGGDVTVQGSEHVDRVVWHDPAFGDEAVAATFQDERAAAVATLRRQAYGRIYRELVTDDE